jgi:uncharacterized protein YndB with AHSA1/START domain
MLTRADYASRVPGSTAIGQFGKAASIAWSSFYLSRVEKRVAVELTDDDLVIVRQLRASQAQAFRAWSDPTRLARWIGAVGFTVPTVQSDFRPGGAYQICIRSPQGEDYWWGGHYFEIAEPLHLRFTVETYGWPGETTLNHAPVTTVTVTFEPTGEGTRMTFRQSPFPPDVDRKNHANGWIEAFHKLEGLLETIN